MDTFPLDATTFIGRTAEIAEITAVLTKADCRLLTVLGPGGIGKTRLAIKVASALASEYADGSYFVPLQAVDTVDLLIAAIADILEFSLASQEKPLTQLLKFLRTKETLLVLDNFEQLINHGGTSTIDEFLSVAPGLNLLVTTREKLGLQGEWIYMLRGLSYPSDKTLHTTKHEAVELFADRASRVNQHFSLLDELTHVVHITQMVDGIPLALELAAAWARLLPCNQIAVEIKKNLDLLQTTNRNLPDRHQSIRLILDQTWEHLSSPEKEVFQRLSIFRGGFQLKAATAVAGAELLLISQLQDKALLQWRADGRYYLHELLRQYGTQKLAQNKSEFNQVRQAHCLYYAGFLHKREKELMGQRQVAAVGEIEAELKNIQDAWQCAIDHGNVPAIQQAAFALGNFYQFQSRYAEGLHAFEQASARLEAMPNDKEAQRALIDTLMVCAWFYLRFGQPQKIIEVMKLSQKLHQQLEMNPNPGYLTDPNVLFAFANLIQGNFTDAEMYANQALATAVQCNHLDNQKFAYFLLSQAAMAQGNLKTARQKALKAFAIVQAADDHWFMAYVLNTLADLATMENDFATAKNHYQASYDIREAFHDTEGMALALNHLSEIALRQENHQEAQRLFEKSLHLYENINDIGGLATSLYGLGHTAVAQHDYDNARHHYARALQLAAEIRFVPLILTLCVGIGELFCRLEQVEEGIPLFAFVLSQEAASQETRVQASQFRDSFKLQLTPKQMKTAVAKGQSATLANTIDRLLAALPLLNVTSPGTAVAHDPNKALVEPLTAREQDVLALLAAGHSNRQIAENLIIAEGTVKYYTRQIYSKLQVKNRTQAVTLAGELGLVKSLP
ncbi:MAG: tetratricopeptide repeat protein [Ardenticatenaceae bacterium]|nr:tetratricopeptide repeat protein [Ardenticatenaceae bacterium]